VTGSPGIALTDEMAIVAYGNFVYSLDVTSGSVNWHYPEDSNNQVVFYAPPLATDDFVYIGDLANNFHKLDRETGKVIWTFSGARGYYIGQAAEADGTVYAPSNDGSLYAIDANGELLWEFKTGHYLWSQPQISGNRIYIGSMDHFVYAISASGEEIWSTDLQGAVVGSPLISEDGSKLYAGSLAEQLVALNATNGETLWTFDTEASVWGTSILVDGTLYFADSGGNIYALEAENGDPIWQTEYAGKVVGGLTAISDGLVLATEEGVVKAFNYDGTPKWEATLDGEIFQAPAANNEYLVAGTINGDNLIYGFNLTGVQLWSTTPEK
jgi:outer membrane protein assembly factor BamB